MFLATTYLLKAHYSLSVLKVPLNSSQSVSHKWNPLISLVCLSCGNSRDVLTMASASVSKITAFALARYIWPWPQPCLVDAVA